LLARHRQAGVRGLERHADDDGSRSHAAAASAVTHRAADSSRARADHSGLPGEGSREASPERRRARRTAGELRDAGKGDRRTGRALVDDEHAVTERRAPRRRSVAVARGRCRASFARVAAQVALAVFAVDLLASGVYTCNSLKRRTSMLLITGAAGASGR